MSVRVGSPPPPVVTPRGGGGSGWVELIKARHDIDAHLLVGRLNEAGVETRTVKDRSAPGAWLFGGSNPWAPVTVLVRKYQLDDARITLAEISFSFQDASPNPPAHTHLLVGPVRARVSTVWWITAIALGLLITSIVVIQALGTGRS